MASTGKRRKTPIPSPAEPDPSSKDDVTVGSVTVVIFTVVFLLLVAPFWSESLPDAFVGVDEEGTAYWALGLYVALPVY